MKPYYIDHDNISDSGSDFELIEERGYQRNNNPIFVITSISICFLNIWTLFSTILWFTIVGIPQEFALFIELVVEIMLFSEAIIRIFTKICCKEYDTLFLLHTRKNDKWWRYWILLIISIPQYTIMILMNNFYSYNIEDPILTIGLPFRLLRIFEIIRFAEKAEEALFYMYVRGFIYFRIFVNLVWVLLLTHLSAAIWLFIQKYAIKEQFDGESENPLNPFRDGLSYFERTNKESASVYEQYIDALQWVVTCVCGCSFGDVTPRLFSEIVASLAVMILGASFLAKLFGDFAALNYLLIKEKCIIAHFPFILFQNFIYGYLSNHPYRKKYIQTIKFCQLHNVPRRIKDKVHSYYQIDNELTSSSKFQDIWENTPICLHTEIMLLINKDFISSCKFFQICSFNFLIALIKHLKPCTCLQEDIIIRSGEVVEDLYFVKDGKIEMISSFDQDNIQILKKGDIFGQMKCSSTNRSDATIKALKKCSLLVLSKNNINKLSEIYPNEIESFQRAANQKYKRILSRNEELQVNTLLQIHRAYDKYDDQAFKGNSKVNSPKKLNQLSKSISLKRSETENSSCKSHFQNYSHRAKHNANNNNNKDKITKRWLLYPFTKSYYIWTYILGLAVCYNLFYVPYSVTFGFEASSTAFIFFDIIAVSIYLLDIIIHFRIPIISVNGFNSNKKAIFLNYLKTYFILDLLSGIPLDYLFEGIGSPYEFRKWIRVLRLIKIIKFINLIQVIMDDMNIQSSLLRVKIFIIIFILMNHFAACGMFAICYLMETNNIETQGLNFFRRYDQTSILNVPLIQQPHWIQYVNFLYWSYQASSSGSTGDVIAITPTEKLFQIIVMLAFRVYLAFLTAEVSNVVATYRMEYSENLEKTEVYSYWMKCAKISLEKRRRVKKFNEYKWQKFQGLNEDQILENLPNTIKLEILEHMLKDILENCDLLPKNEPGFISSLLKKFSFTFLTDGEYLLRKGEIAEEVYFLIEGRAAVLDEDEKTVLIILKKNDILGEMGIAQRGSGLRTKSVKAITSLSLATIAIQDFIELCEHFPLVGANVRQKIESRNRFNMEAKARNDKLRQASNLEAPNINIEKELDYELKTENPLKYDLELERKESHEKSNKIPKAHNYQPRLKSNRLQKYQSDLGVNSLKDTGFDKNYTTKIGIHKTYVSDHGFSLKPKPQKINEDYFLVGQVSRPTTKRNDTEGLNKTIEIEDGNKSSKGIRTASSNEALKTIELISKSKTNSTKIRKNLKDFFTKFKDVIITIIAWYNFAFMPLKIAFGDITYTIPLIIIEGFCLLFLFYYCLLNLISYINHKKAKNYDNFFATEENNNTENDVSISYFETAFNESNAKKYNNIPLWIIIKDMLAIIPFSLIFDLTIDSNTRIHSIPYSLLQLNRLLIGEKLYLVLKFKIFRKKLAITNIFTILYTFFIMNHVAACGWIITANLSDNDMNYTWLSKIPAPYFAWPTLRSSKNIEDYASPSVIYLSALYWSYFNSSHIGGDINAINVAEKIYTSAYILIALLFYVVLFGDLVSLMDNIRPKFQIIFEKNYYTVLEYLKSNGLNVFAQTAKKYYDHLWTSSRGINEEQIFNELPNTLKFEILLEYYNEPIHFCSFFRDEHSSTNYNIANYFFKKCQYSIYMPGETIVSAGSLVDSIYIILEGQAEKKNKSKKGNQQLAIKLEPGAVFGGIIPLWKQIHDIVVITSSKCAILDGKSYSILCKAYPRWAERRKFNVKSYRMLTNFIRAWKKSKESRNQAQKLPDDNENATMERNSKPKKSIIYRTRSKSITDQPELDGISKPTPLLYRINESSVSNNVVFNISSAVEFKRKNQENLKNRQFYFHPNSRAKIVGELLHLAFILYTIIMLPVIVGFKMEFSEFTLTMEILCLIESLFYITSQFFTARYVFGTLTLDRQILLKYFLKHGLVIEIIGALPFNLFFGLMNDYPLEYIIDFTRVLRVILLFRSVDILDSIMTNYPRAINWINILKPWLLLIIVTHISGCLWIWLNMVIIFLNSFRQRKYRMYFEQMERRHDVDMCWFNFLEMNLRDTGEIYIFASFYVINIATTTGFPEMILTNYYERALFIFYVYIGDALFALAFGLIVASSKVLPEKYENVYDKISKIHTIAEENGISTKVRSKLEEFFEFLVTRRRNANFLHDLDGLLPKNMAINVTIKKLSGIYMCPLFDNARSLKFLEDLVRSLEQRIYLTNDYLTRRGDHDRNLFFVHEGQANILAKKQVRIVKTLAKGSYIGIFSILFLTKRKNSVVSLGNCIAYVLSHREFQNLLQKYPINEVQIRTNAYKIAMSFGLDKSFVESIIKPGKNQQIDESKTFELKEKNPKFNCINIDEILPENRYQNINIGKMEPCDIKGISSNQIKNRKRQNKCSPKKVICHDDFDIEEVQSLKLGIREKFKGDSDYHMKPDNKINQKFSMGQDQNNILSLDLRTSKEKQLSTFSELKIK